MVKDLTKGNPLKLILGFYFPIMAGTLLQQAYNIADTVVVGQMVGADALAAVGATGSITFLVLGFVNGCCAGATIPVAAHFGAGRPDKMRRAVAGALNFTLLICGVITVLALPLLRPILRLMQYPREIFDYSYIYLLYIFAGTVCLGLSNLASGLLRAVGNSRTPLYSLAVAGIVNVGLNILFVRMGMKVVGVALGTVISQLVSAVICTVYIFRKVPELIPRREDFALSCKAMHKASSLGVPMGFQFSITAIGTIVVQSVVNSLGAVAVSAVTLYGKISLVFTGGVMEPIGLSMVTYVSQNLGAGRIDRIRRGMRTALWLISGITAASMLIGIFAGREMMSIFLSSAEPMREEILSTATHCLTLFTLCYPVLMPIFLYRNAVQGLGYGKIAMIGGVLELIGRCVISLALVGPLGLTGPVLASPVAWLLASIFFIIAYEMIVRRLERHRERK